MYFISGDSTTKITSILYLEATVDDMWNKKNIHYRGRILILGVKKEFCFFLYSI